MQQRTAVIKVSCDAGQWGETAHTIAWAVGHNVVVRLPHSHPGVIWVYIVTDFGYVDDGGAVLEQFGLGVVGIIPGVLSWTVIPGDTLEADMADSSDATSTAPLSRSRSLASPNGRGH